jgi:hypothetical protein
MPISTHHPRLSRLVTLLTLLGAVPTTTQARAEALVRRGSATEDAHVTETPAAGATKDNQHSFGAYLEDDLGVLLLFGGVGLSGGVSYGPLRAGLSFYRFESPYPGLSGAPEGFEVKVDGLVGADVAFHLFSDRVAGGYVRLIGQLKRQRIENLGNGARRRLESALIGPEIGWVLRVHRGLYLAPRLGALYYVRPPQGADGRAVDVGGASYDNPRHKTWDVYGTLGLGYAFD